MTFHGGDVWQVSRETGIAEDEILDFSSSINPRGLPQAARERLARDAANPRLLGRYPDPSARALRRALSAKLSVPEEAIVIGPGAEGMLSPILRTIQAAQALVPVPAFSEYRRVCAQSGIEFQGFPLCRSENFRVPVARFCGQSAARKGAAVILNNPHNPSGAVLKDQEVRRIAEAARSAGASLLLDEAFIDYVPGASLASDAASNPGLIVLRSLTKFYGCPALRIGYAVAHPETARRIRELLPTWGVAQLAIDALAMAIADREYEELSIRENDSERARLSPAIEALGIRVLPSGANYLLLDLPGGGPRAADLRMRLLAEHRILIRNCDTYEAMETGRYIRVAVRSRGDNERLTAGLAAIMTQASRVPQG